MNTVSLSVFHLVPRLALLGALLVLGLCAAWLLASAVSGSLDAAGPKRDGPLLAPYRWISRANGLA